MTLRKRLNQNPRATAAAVGGLVLLAIVVAAVSSRPPGAGGAPAPAGKEFFSVDDGKNWFADDAAKLPPFDHQGKPAYRARVYRCPHGKEFVSHLERYNDADKKRLEAAIANAEPGSAEFAIALDELEVKKPGGKEWVKVGKNPSARASAVRIPKCPEGSTAGLTRVSPPQN